MDNKIFNVNGRSQELLLKTLELCLEAQYVEGWCIHPKHGFTLLWHVKDKSHNKFPINLSAQMITPIVFEWLNSEEAEKIPCIDMDADIDHDGHNHKGWRVHINGELDTYAMCAIKPAYLWYGK